jgi:ABC-type nickel/cobalt efflux system permease component RcnA
MLSKAKLLTWLLMLWWVSLTGPPAAAAHPADELYQVTYITLSPHQVKLQIELYPGILTAPGLLALIDANQDGLISGAESRAYVDHFLSDIIFEIDNLPVPLNPADLAFATPMDLRGGVGVIRFNLYADTPSLPPGQHRLFYANHHQPEVSVYLVNAISESTQQVKAGQPERDVLQQTLRLDYTLNSGLPVEPAPVEAPPALEIPGEASAGQKQLTRYLYDSQLSPPVIALALGLAMLLGSLHALTPGHGKTLVGAYLIGSRGTISHAITLGGIVTFTHTASVIGIGLLALLASQFIVPNLLTPSLEMLSGLLVVFMGARLWSARWQDLSGHAQSHHHHHDHTHSHDHPHDHEHNHQLALPERVTLGDLLTLGISGGLVPCPEALGIMVIAVGLNRIVFGLGLIVAFSFGLAAVLIAIGILLVRSKSLLERAGEAGHRWQKWLPLASAIIITLLGATMVVKGVLSYL